MHFWRLIRASIYSPAFYRSLPERPLLFSIRYFYMLGVVLAIVFTTTVSLQAIPFLSQFLDRTGQALVANFPENFVLTIRDGEASVNVPEPYALPLPDEVRREIQPSGKQLPHNLLVVDTAAPASAEAWTERDTFVLITKQNLVWGEPGERVQIQWLDQFPDATINRALARNLSDQLSALGRWLAPVVVFGAWFAFLLLWTFLLVYFFIGGLIAWLIARMRKAPVPYRTAYQMAMHAWTPVALLLVVVSGGIFSPGIPFLPTLLLIVALFANIRRAPGESAPADGGSSSVV